MAEKKKQIRDEREAQRQLEMACRHHFGPDGDMTPEQIKRLRSSQKPENSTDPYWGGGAS
jgi:hypothetical protein